ncbi:MAG: hypothetical protein J6562_06140, partial [Candidatus Schmidhempelia sp.]|nr:hypothetical protein [Candidatus Schmidhempelia sp.]
MEIVKFDLLSSKFSSSISSNKGNIPLLRKSKKVGLFFNLVFWLFIMLFGMKAHAAIYNIKSTKFDCNSLYSVSEGIGYPNGTTGTVYKLDPLSGNKEVMYSLGYWGSTIALGYKGGRNSGGPLVMYAWPYGAHASRKPWTVEYGATNNDQTLFPYDFRGTYPFQDLGNTWAGGEVNQITGEIYMTNVAGSVLNTVNTGNFRLGIFDPNTGASRIGIPKPLTNSDTVEGMVGSDMAIDAEGNAYLIVNDNRHGNIHKVLIKVMPTANSEYWPYVLVQHFRQLPGDDVWGMAFLDGKLYTSAANFILWRSNPLTGTSERLPTALGDTRDLSSCQVAPIIKGKVYLDPIGEGNFKDFSGTVPNVEVELWKNGEVVASHETSEAGEFNFIVDSVNNQDYYVRIAHPEVKGMRAKQTWASANINSNSVTAYCGGTGKNPPKEMKASGPCFGANKYESVSTPASVDKSYIYSKVNMRTDDVVAEASFAITVASNYGDAPSSYQGTKPAQHVTTGAGNTLDEFVNLLR